MVSWQVGRLAGWLADWLAGWFPTPTNERRFVAGFAGCPFARGLKSMCPLHRESRRGRKTERREQGKGRAMESSISLRIRM